MPKTDPEYTVINETRKCTVANRVRKASTSATRRKGLLGVTHLDEHSGLWIVPCEGVHTFFMRIPIDVVFLDRDSRVRKIRPNLGAWRMSLCLTARSVLELAAGAMQKSGTQVGDRLILTPNRQGES
jgi:uncharacterized membrane protein (UPF0127 family)